MDQDYRGGKRGCSLARATSGTEGETETAAKTATARATKTAARKHFLKFTLMCTSIDIHSKFCIFFINLV